MKESRKKLGTNLMFAPQYRRVEKVRHTLTQFMQALLNHITRTALQESWKKLKTDLAKTSSIEEIYRKHVSYLKRILFILMLKDKCGKFRDYLERAFILILKFYRWVGSETEGFCNEIKRNLNSLSLQVSCWQPVHRRPKRSQKLCSSAVWENCQDRAAL